MIDDNVRITVSIPKSEYEDIKKVFEEVLGNEYIYFIKFEVRKLTKEEIDRRLFYWSGIAFIIFIVGGMALTFAGLITGKYLNFYLYLINVVALLFGIKSIMDSIKRKQRILLFFGVFAVLTNGILSIWNLIELYTGGIS